MAKVQRLPEFVPQHADPAAAKAARLLESHGHLSGADLLRPMIREVFRGRVALASSFGAEAAVLLALVAEVEPATPVLFTDTGRLFPETLHYRDALVALLGLRNVRTLKPEAETLLRVDPDGRLWDRDPDTCCAVRKVEPFAEALAGYEAWITGRKRFQGGLRAALPKIEAADGQIKINPLVDWSADQIDTFFAARGLPRHPLVARGFSSIGCWPCTEPDAKQGSRDGRWKGRSKDECGIHTMGRGRRAGA